VAAARDALAARGCSVLVVAQAQPKWLAHYAARTSWGVPLACDPERRAYAAFGLERAKWRTFFNPRVLWGYFRAMFRGYRVRTPYAGEDVLQLGGDFVLARDLRVVYARPSINPTDRPAVSDVLAALPVSEPNGDESASAT
jgi:AhpC/TSA antioxidant enzyme